MNPQTLLLILRFVPFVFILIGIILALVNNDMLYLLLLGGMALIELVIFSFIKIPSALQMDKFGFTLHILSLRGTRKRDILWNEVDYLSSRNYRTKSGRVVSYHAHLQNGKKVNFMSFGHSALSDEGMLEINGILRQISNKEVRKQ